MKSVHQYSSLSVKCLCVFDYMNEMHAAPTCLISYKAVILFLVSKVCALSQGEIHKVRGIRTVHTIKVYVSLCILLYLYLCFSFHKTQDVCSPARPPSTMVAGTQCVAQFVGITQELYEL